MRRNLLLLTVLIALPAPAYALSCAKAVLDETSYKSSPLIFEGTVVNAVPKDQPDTPSKAMTSVTYTFKVNRVWKGEGITDMAVVERNTYWGDEFAQNVPYLIVASQHDGLYTADLCGNSMPVEYATQQLTFLNQKSGENQ